MIGMFIATNQRPPHAIVRKARNNVIRFKKDNMRLSKLEIDEVSLIVKILGNQP